MLLIADSGSTKTDWALAEPTAGRSIKVYHTVGYNPFFINSEGIFDSLSQTLLPELDASGVKRIFFYGAGCSTSEKQAVVRVALAKAFPHISGISVNHDLLASARALLGKEPGFAAILGTGTNTCLYDGNTCYLNIDSLGYLLGDEGSGSHIGKKILRDFMRGQLEPELEARFRNRFHITNNSTILDTLYSTQFPNRYLAGFCSFADEFSTHPYIRRTVMDSFHEFFENLVTNYPDYKDYPLNCVGSVGYAFKDLLTETAQVFGMKTGKVIRSPLNDLVQFHLENINQDGV